MSFLNRLQATASSLTSALLGNTSDRADSPAQALRGCPSALNKDKALAPLLNRSPGSDGATSSPQAGTRRVALDRLQAQGHHSDDAHGLAEARGADLDRLQALLLQNPGLLTTSFGAKKESLLTEAARKGKTFHVQAFVDQVLSSFEPKQAAAIINHQNTDGETALAQAIEAGHLGVVTALLGYAETDVNRANKRHQTPLHLAAKQENARFAIDLLSHASINPSLPDDNGDTLLHVAIRSNRSEVAAKIADHPRSLLDQPNRKGQTPLRAAIVQALALGTGSWALPTFDDAQGAWRETLCKLAASPHVDVNSRGPDGETPLTYLCKQRLPMATHYASDPLVRLAVTAAFANRQVEAVKAVLASRADLDLDATNRGGNTPYQVASQETRRALKAVLQKPQSTLRVA